MTGQLVPWAIQCTMVSLVVVGLLLALPRASVHLRRALTSIALFSFLVPPLVRAPLTLAAHGLDVGQVGTSGILWWTLGLHWLGVAIVLWMGARSLSRHARDLRDAVPIAPGPLGTALSEMCEQLGLTSTPRLLVSLHCVVPCVAVGIRSRIVLPQRYLEALDLDQLCLIVGHELVHIRQGDLRWGGIRWLVCALWWFHPLAWIVARRHRDLGELCCDVTLLTELDARPVDYAECLVEAAQLGLCGASSGLVPALFDHTEGSLQHRLRQIGRRPRDRWSTRRTWLAWATALALLPLATAWFAPAAGPDGPEPGRPSFHPHEHSHLH